jgi:thermostable 8-oxoguanine DNA glycosylase
MNYKVDPDNITDFYLDDDQLELNILFWIFAAGKNGHTASKCLNNFLSFYNNETKQDSPFNIIKKINKLPESLKSFGVGCYNNKSRTIKDLIDRNLDLKKCNVEDLENIWGMGSKTSRCFLIHSRKNQNFAGLDRHILRYLKEIGHDVPNQTPNKKQYLKIEKIFIELARNMNKTISELDLEIWKKYRMKT